MVRGCTSKNRFRRVEQCSLPVLMTPLVCDTSCEDVTCLPTLLHASHLNVNEKGEVVGLLDGLGDVDYRPAVFGMFQHINIPNIASHFATFAFRYLRIRAVASNITTLIADSDDEDNEPTSFAQPTTSSLSTEGLTLDPSAMHVMVRGVLMR